MSGAAARTVPTEKTLKEYAEALAARGHVKAAAELIDAHLAQHDAGWGLWMTFAQLSRRLGQRELAVAAYRASARQLEAAGHVGPAYAALKAGLTLTPDDAVLRDEVTRVAKLRDRNRERPTLHLEPGSALHLVPPPVPTPPTVRPIPPPIPARLRGKAAAARTTAAPRPAPPGALPAASLPVGPAPRAPAPRAPSPPRPAPRLATAPATRAPAPRAPSPPRPVPRLAMAPATRAPAPRAPSPPQPAPRLAMARAPATSQPAPRLAAIACAAPGPSGAAPRRAAAPRPVVAPATSRPGPHLASAPRLASASVAPPSPQPAPRLADARPIAAARAAPAQTPVKRPSVTDPYLAIFDILDDEQRRAR
ncbi:MAG: hypothetical protein JNJ54_11030 [Myxococcaceae bacterium]|nr:hypothetical protein [Myxococcaceae bacterium]